jgi:hypothetical protein
MASKIPNGGGSVYLNLKGMRELLKSQQIRAELVERMARVAAAIPGSKLEAAERRTRVVVKVISGSDFDEAETGKLSRALDLAGGLRGTKKQFSEAATRKRRRA